MIYVDMEIVEVFCVKSGSSGLLFLPFISFPLRLAAPPLCHNKSEPQLINSPSAAREWRLGVCER